MSDSTSRSSVTWTPDAVDLKSEIRHRAYNLYELRGRVNGFALDDWLQAQAEWLEEYLQSQVEASAGK